MRRVGHDSAVRELSAAHDPVLRVSQGEAFEVGARSLLTDGPLPEDGDFSGLAIPVTGPIAIEGIKSGDVLRVDIEHIEIASRGAMVTVPGRGGFSERFRAWGHAVEISEGLVHFDEDTTVPVRPMIGKLAVAPRDGVVDSSTVGAHGGNMDCPDLVAGASVFLPVEVDDALIYVGDLHAAQGWGECSLTGVEVEGAVRLTCEQAESLTVSRPIIVTADAVITVGDGASLDEAARYALDDMAGLVMRDRGWSLEKTAMLLSAAGDLAISQLVNPRVSVTMSLARTQFLAPPFSVDATHRPANRKSQDHA